MRVLQFWILMFASCFVAFLYIRQISLERDLDEQQRLVVDSQETITEGNAYENAWKQLAMSVYQNSRQDPDLANVLKMENVDVRPSTPPPVSSPSSTPSGSTPSKAPLHPASP